MTGWDLKVIHEQLLYSTVYVDFTHDHELHTHGVHVSL